MYSFAYSCKRVSDGGRASKQAPRTNALGLVPSFVYVLGPHGDYMTMAKRQKIGKAPRNSTPHPWKKSRFLQRAHCVKLLY